MKRIFKKILKKFFKRKIEIELVNYTGMDIDVLVEEINENSLKLIIINKKEREILENKNAV